MTSDRTFAMIKPDSVEKNYIGAIIEKITSSGFKLIAMQMKRLTEKEAKEFYSIHKEKSFFDDLIAYITRGPIVAIALKKENAVDDFRTLIGGTNPEEAAEGTIRKLYAESISENAIHGSDSNENAQDEIRFHFNKNNIF